MRVKYKTVLDEIDTVVRLAAKRERTIEHVTLTLSEWAEFKIALYELSPPMACRITGPEAMYLGVTIKLEGAPE